MVTQSWYLQVVHCNYVNDIVNVLNNNHTTDMIMDDRHLVHDIPVVDLQLLRLLNSKV